MTISGGAVAGSLPSGTRLAIAASGTFDVSTYTHYTLGTSASLTASGTGTTLGVSAAAIQGAAGGTIDLGTRPVTLNYDGSHPALYISQGALSLTGNAFTVNRAAPLVNGTYTLVQQATGSITGSGPFTVTGTAIGSGKSATIAISGNTVVLTVSGAGTPFSNWIDGIAGMPAGQTGFGDDPNKDGVANGLAWILLGGAPMGDSRASLPVATQSTGKVVLEFTCLKPGELGAATLELQYGNDLGTWQAAVVPGSNTTVNSVVFTITSYDATHNHVKAEIPQAAAAGGKLFSRLHAILP